MPNDDHPLAALTSAPATDQELPCNLTFSFVDLGGGNVYVSLSGFTAGPPATIDSPTMIVAGYNPATFFNGWSLGGQYGAYAMAYLGEKDGAPTLFFQGWVTGQSCDFVFRYVSYEFPLS